MQCWVVRWCLECAAVASAAVGAVKAVALAVRAGVSDGFAGPSSWVSPGDEFEVQQPFRPHLNISFPDTFFWESWRGIQFWRTLESQREISFWDIHMYFTRMGRFVIFQLRGSHLQSNRNLLVSQCWRNPLEICRASRFYSSLTLPRLATMWDELKMQFYGQLPRCPVPHSSLPATQRPTTFSQPLLCKIQSLSLEICNVCGDPSWPK